MQFTSNVGFSANETPITLDWAEENFELVFRGILDKHFLINKQANCFLTWNMDDCGDEWWQLRLYHAVFAVEHIEEFEWICKTFGVKQKKDSEMVLIAPIELKTKTPITQEKIREKYLPKVQYGGLSLSIGRIEYMIDTELKLWAGFQAKVEEDESNIYIYSSGCECKLEVKYMEQIDWVIKKLKNKK